MDDLAIRPVHGITNDPNSARYQKVDGRRDFSQLYHLIIWEVIAHQSCDLNHRLIRAPTLHPIWIVALFSLRSSTLHPSFKSTIIPGVVKAIPRIATGTRDNVCTSIF
jgi:hypothetical protein